MHLSLIDDQTRSWMQKFVIIIHINLSLTLDSIQINSEKNIFVYIFVERKIVCSRVQISIETNLLTAYRGMKNETNELLGG